VQAAGGLGIMGTTQMPDIVTTPRNRSRVPQPRPSPGNGRASKWSRQPHHRRRRTLAGLGLLAIVLILVIVASSGGGGASHPVVVRGAGLFSRIQTLSGTGAGSFAATQTAAENAAINRTLAYTPFIRVAGAQHREIALTFDDGPGPYTQQLVSTLDQLSVPATFFEIGVSERYFSAGTSAVISHGYSLGDHTFSHAPLSQLSAADQQSQILSEANTLVKYGAPFPRLFRPPYGLFNGTTLQLMRKYRMLMVLWTVDTSDYRLPGTSSIIDTVVSGAQPGAIILMHDAGGNRSETVAALPKLVEDLRAKGYRLVTVPKLILDNPPPANQQSSSTSGSGG
jgi:peptidoglycan/xylan/chitin deacetylase (PgdA/CDA1 family)